MKLIIILYFLIINQWRKLKISNKWIKYKTFTRNKSIKDVKREVKKIYRKITRIVEKLGRKNYYLG